jgi:hypothetical protein
LTGENFRILGGNLLLIIEVSPSTLWTNSCRRIHCLTTQFIQQEFIARQSAPPAASPLSHSQSPSGCLFGPGR